MRNKYKIIPVIVFLFLSEIVLSQISEGGTPLSFSGKVSTAFQEVFIAPPDLDLLAREDAIQSKDGSGYRFAVLLPVNLNMKNSGTWEEMDDGSKIWRLRLFSEGAEAVSLYFDKFHIPEGGKLFLYDDNMTQLLGAFTLENNKESGRFATGLMQGSSVILEYNLPSGSNDVPEISVSDFGYAYRGVYSNERGFGGSDPCEINIGCSPEGDSWQDEKHGVCRIQIKVGGAAYWCSGSLVNNVRNDKTPYVLTADHCAFKFGHYASQEDLDSWIFYFNYFSDECENPPSEPGSDSFTGAVKIAQGGNHSLTGSDFYLVLLQDNIPPDYNLYFNGWNTADVPVSHGVTIHHPEGDIQKISTFTTPLQTSSFNGNGLPSHWKVYWSETENNWGVTEGGSSGSPLYDSLGRIIGTLTGGLASCSNQEDPDYYGKFSYHWTSNGNADTAQLKPWLDPDNTGVTTLNGTYVGIDNRKISNNNEIKIHPNPSKGFIKINFINFGHSKIELTIIDLLGNIRKSGRIVEPDKELEISLDGLPSGIYFVRAVQDNVVIVKRIIKN